MKEIERKFLVKKVPESIKIISTHIIRQTYLALTEDEEIRVRHTEDILRSSSQYTWAYKKNTPSKLVRTEEETSISEELYYDLVGNRFVLIKLRSIIDIGTGGFCCLDNYIFTGDKRNNTPLMLEVEFQTESEASAFQVPDWVEKEVTNDCFFKASTIWKQIFPF